MPRLPPLWPGGKTSARRAGERDRTPLYPRGSVVKESAPSAADLGSIPAFSVVLFRGRVIPVTSKLALQWLPCQAPGVIGSALGLVGPVSVYVDGLT